MVHQELERLYLQEPLLITLTVLLSEFLGLNWSKSILVRVQEWLENFLLWQDNTLLASFS